MHGAGYEILKKTGYERALASSSWTLMKFMSSARLDSGALHARVPQSAFALPGMQRLLIDGGVGDYRTRFTAWRRTGTMTASTSRSGCRRALD